MKKSPLARWVALSAGFVMQMVALPHLTAQPPVEVPFGGDIELVFEKIITETTTNYVLVEDFPRYPMLVEVATSARIKSLYCGGGQVFWSTGLSWDSPTLHLQNACKVVAHLLDTPESVPELVAWLPESLTPVFDGGPTEWLYGWSFPVTFKDRSLSEWSKSFSCGFLLQYLVTIPAGADVIMNQTSKIESLTVEPGGRLEGQSALEVMKDVHGYGAIVNLNCLVHGDFINKSEQSSAGPLTVGGTLNNDGVLSVSTALSVGRGVNSGTLVLEGTPFDPPASFDNREGMIRINGGRLSGSAGFANAGRIEASAGEITQIPNRGVIALTDGGDVHLSYVTNGGAFVQQTTNTVWIGQGATFENLAGGSYEVVGSGLVGWWQRDGSSLYENRGVLRKSGEGTALMECPFNNFGTVEVTGGVLQISSSGTGSNEVYQLADGGRVQRLAGSECTTAGTMRTVGGALEVMGKLSGAPWFELAPGSWLEVSGELANVRSAGRVEVRGGAVAHMDNAGQVTLTEGPELYLSYVTNAGTFVQQRTNTVWIGQGATFENLAGGSYEVVGSGLVGWWQRDGSSLYENRGVLRKSGEGTALMECPFNNFGTVEVGGEGLVFHHPPTSVGAVWRLEGGTVWAPSPTAFTDCALSGTGAILAAVAFSGLTTLSPQGAMVFGSDVSFAGDSTNLLTLSAMAGSNVPYCIQVQGTAALGGKLFVDFAPTLLPLAETAYRFMSNAATSGTFHPEAVGVGSVAGLLFQVEQVDRYVALRPKNLEHSYANWVVGRFSLDDRNNPAVTGVGADPDGDGRSNMIEYAFGTDPHQADATVTLRASVRNQAPCVQYRKRKDTSDLTFTLLGASDPDGPWLPVGHAEVTPQTSEPADTPSIEWATAELRVLPESGGRFYRLRVDFSGGEPLGGSGRTVAPVAAAAPIHDVAARAWTSDAIVSQRIKRSSVNLAN